MPASNKWKARSGRNTNYYRNAWQLAMVFLHCVLCCNSNHPLWPPMSGFIVVPSLCLWSYLQLSLTFDHHWLKNAKGHIYDGSFLNASNLGKLLCLCLSTEVRLLFRRCKHVPKETEWKCHVRNFVISLFIHFIILYKVQKTEKIFFGNSISCYERGLLLLADQPLSTETMLLFPSNIDGSMFIANPETSARETY